MPLPKTDRVKVLHRLAEGYGVEDIAVMDSLPLNQVRAYMHKLARDGVFDRVYAQRCLQGK